MVRGEESGKWGKDRRWKRGRKNLESHLAYFGGILGGASGSFSLAASGSEMDLRCSFVRGDIMGGLPQEGLGGRSGGGIRGGTIGTPSSPHSVERGRGGTGGMITLGLGGGVGVMFSDE
jgi:hypothetical protein